MFEVVLLSIFVPSIPCSLVSDNGYSIRVQTINKKKQQKKSFEVLLLFKTFVFLPPVVDTIRCWTKENFFYSSNAYIIFFLTFNCILIIRLYFMMVLLHFYGRSTDSVKEKQTVKIKKKRMLIRCNEAIPFSFS